MTHTCLMWDVLLHTVACRGSMVRLSRASISERQKKKGWGGGGIKSYQRVCVSVNYSSWEHLTVCIEGEDR